jgi:hypothetical protein
VVMRRILTTMICGGAFALALAGCAPRLAPGPPPAPKAEVRPVRPYPNAVWVAGHWKWAGNRWAWEGGHWARPPRQGATWVPGHWVSTPKGHKWVKGHWK